MEAEPPEAQAGASPRKPEASASDESKPESNGKDSSNGDGRDDEEPPAAACVSK